MRNVTWIIPFVLLSCAVKQPINEDQPHSSDASPSLWVSLQAKNLSEDMSVLSTRNDETVLLIYAVTSQDTTLILNQQHTYTQRNELAHHVIRDTSKYRSPWLVVLIELDSDRDSSEIEPIVTKNLKSLSSLLMNEEYNALSKLLGIDDLLGTQRVDSTRNSLIIKGIHRADLYEYELKRFMR